MRRLILALAALLVAPAAHAQTAIVKYLDPNGKPTSVTPNNALPTRDSVPSSASDSISQAVFQNQSSGVVKGAPGVFVGAVVTLATGNGPGFFMLFNSVTPPADGALSGANLPGMCIYVPAGPSTSSFYMGNRPGWATTGVSWAFSSGADCQHKTAATANFVSVSFK